MQQSRADQPGHEAGILNRVPEPPAAPAQLIIGPKCAQGYANGQKAPGREAPGPHPARPGRIDPALDQGGNGKRKYNRKPNIAAIEKRRVKGQGRVLQKRIERLALNRHIQ